MHHATGRVRGFYAKMKRLARFGREMGARRKTRGLGEDLLILALDSFIANSAAD
jgi:hypothetical protein